jgi:hypothetical protein
VHQCLRLHQQAAQLPGTLRSRPYGRMHARYAL